MIMAGGASEALSVLTAVRAEPAIPFGGKYRIIDFPLSNCVNSEIFNVALLTQHMPRSLNDHVGVGKPWDLDRSKGGVRLLQPYLGRDTSGWQQGTADAVRRNLDFVEEQRVDTVLILAGDHIYKMDYRPMLRLHQAQKADVTVAVRRVNPHETYRFGIVTTNADGTVINFEEKPRRSSRSNLASMGIYVFNYSTLVKCLTEQTEPPRVDFGRDVLPAIIHQERVLAYPFEGYWADVGTLQAYWEANMALLGESPALDLYDPEWVIHTRSEEQPPAKIGPEARVGGNLLSNGCIVEGIVERSVISPGVYISASAVVRDSVVMNDTHIGPNTLIERAIIDKEVDIPEGVHIGFGDDNAPNKQMPGNLNTGLTVIGKRARLPAGVRIGHNVIINPGVRAEDFPGQEIPSGETV
ncbi:MAG: glucose-1-phosphate adenylyltransferase family protein [Anaerolineae bacterium]